MTMENYFVLTLIWGAIMLGTGWWMGAKGFASIWTMIQTDITNLKNDVTGLKIVTGTSAPPLPLKVIPVVPSAIQTSAKTIS